MKRRLIIIAIFLLAGAVVNVAVAWGIAGASTHYETVRLQVLECREGERLVWALTSFGSELVVHRPFIGPPSDQIERELGRFPYERANPSRNDWSLLRNSESLPNILMEEACGWPGLALRWHQRRTKERRLRGGIELGGTRRYFFTGSPMQPVTRPIQSGTGGRVISARIQSATYHTAVGDRTLPLIPIWRGFAVNTLFYAIVLWLLIRGPFVLRRFIRAKRGLCPACAYPRGESAVCTECGKALPTRAKVTT